MEEHTLSSLVSFQETGKDSYFPCKSRKSCFEKALMEMQSAGPIARSLQNPTPLIQKRDTKPLLVTTETLSNRSAV